MFERVGIGNASTFLGFCGEHDREVFAAIETHDDVSFGPDTSVVVGIRAIALEWYRKCVLAELQQSIKAELGEQASHEKNQMIAWVEKGARQAIEHNLESIRRLFNAFHRKPLSNFYYLAVEFDARLPFACTGAFEPQWSLNREYLFRKDPMRVKWNQVSVLVGNMQGKGYAILCGSQRYKDHRIDLFLKSIGLDPRHLASTMFTICLGHSENCFLRESWFDSLGQKELDQISRLIHSGVNEGINDPSPLETRIDIGVSGVNRIMKSWV